MQTLGPLLQSIAMIAAFALGAGGMWMIVKRRETKKGVLMLVMALVLLANVLIWAMPAPVA